MGNIKPYSLFYVFFFSSRRRHTRLQGDWSSDVCSSDLQQPCYCYCDRSMGHKSLHSCFSSTHGSECGTCLKELYYTYTMYKRGKTAREIRAGIIKGDWKTVDLATAASIN